MVTLSSLAIHSPLEVSTDPVTHLELRRAIQTLASGKAIKVGDLPIEFYKAFAAESGVHV